MIGGLRTRLDARIWLQEPFRRFSGFSEADCRPWQKVVKHSEGFQGISSTAEGAQDYTPLEEAKQKILAPASKAELAAEAPLS